MVGYDRLLPRASQEAAAWLWAVENALEPPNDKVRRHMIQAVWHYVVDDARRYNRGEGPKLQTAMVAPTNDPTWEFFRRVEPDAGVVARWAAKVAACT